MSVWVTEKVLRLALRCCSRRFLWQQRRFLETSSIKYKSFSWGTMQSQTGLARSSVTSERFYSQGIIDELEDKEHLCSPPAEISLPAEMHSAEAASEQRHRKSPFSDQLQLCGSPSDVLDLTCKYAPTVGQISNSLNRMWSTTKKMSDKQQRYELQLMFEHPAFDRLLQKAMTSVGHMHNETLTYSLLSMVKLGVPQQSRVIQTFLRACQVNSHRFSI